MGISHEEKLDIHGAVFEVSNEAFALEYEPYKRLQGQQDVFFKKDTGELFAAEFLGDRVRLISTGGNVAAVESILNSQGIKDFRNMLIDMLGMDEGLKW